MEDSDIDQIIKESEESFAKMKRDEEDAVKDIVKYFDRIHNNLFSYNNILIGGFFAMGQINSAISKWTIIIPICNLWFLIYIDYRMMEKSRFEASITNQPVDKFPDHGRYISNTNLISFASIVTTLGVTISFLYFLL